MNTVDPDHLSRRELSGLMNGLVFPRPIAWVSTISAAGRRNLAPFSYFNVFSYEPPVVGIGPGRRSGAAKDTLQNIQDTGEFVVNMISLTLAERANLTSANVGPEEDEWDLASLGSTPSEVVRPARVTASPASMECEVLKVVDLGELTRNETNSLVLGQVRRVHLADRVLRSGTLIPDPEELDLVGRMGGDAWCTTRDIFRIQQPK